MNVLHLTAHSGLFLDMRDILARLGHRAHSWCLSNSTWYARGRQDPELTGTISSEEPGPDACERFHRRYGHALACFDAFVIDHPIWFAALFERIGKPIVANATTRYDLSAADPDRRAWLDDTLIRMRARGQLVPVSNNKGDAAYLWERFGFEWPTTPSLCEHTGAAYVGDRPEWLLSALGRSPLPAPYAWAELGRYQGIRHVPYNVSIMSVTEQYAAAIPLVFPSPERLLAMAVAGDMNAMAQVSARPLLGLPPGEGWDDYTSPETLRRWIALSDWYDEEWMPHVAILDDPFDSGALQALRPREMSSNVAAFNVARRDRILRTWQATLSTLPV